MSIIDFIKNMLTNYFDHSINFSTKERRCFIYDPASHRAFFDYKPAEDDVYITKILHNRLYYRPIDSEAFIGIPSISLYIPLLKSNLQKAIRRKNVE